jgi:hypothetical protein
MRSIGKARGRGFVAVLAFVAVVNPVQLLLNRAAAAQSTNGTLVVTCKDERSDLIPSAEVIVVNEGTQQELTLITDENGVARFAQLPVAFYTVTVKAEGFKQYVSQNVKIDVGQVYSLVANLTAGNISEVVTVTAGEELVNTTTADITTTVSMKQVNDLPLDGRNPIQLVNLQAGTNSNGRTNTAVNGQRVSSANVTQDGLNIQDNFIRAGGIEVVTTRPSVAEVAEFSVTTTNAGVEASGASTVRLVTPSGTNELHGTVFEYNRNDALGANDFFNNATSPAVERPQLNRNQFGFTIGGPIVIPKVYDGKDKFFFFGSYEGQRQREGIPVDTLVLLPEARQGIFTYVDNSGFTRKLNVLQAGGFAVDPVAASIIAQIPTTVNNNIFGDGLNTSTYSFNKSFFWDRDQGGVRLDYNLNEEHRVEAVYRYTGEELARTDIDTTFNQIPIGRQSASTHFAVVAWDWTITDSLINEVRVGTVNSTVPFFLTEDQGLGYLVNIPLVTNPYVTSQIVPQGRRTITSQLIDTANFAWRDHNFVGGVEFDQIRVRSWTSFGRLPTFGLGFGSGSGSNGLDTPDFPGGIDGDQLDTANDLLALLAGVIATGSITYQVTSQDSGFVPGALETRHLEINQYSWFIGDSWRIHPRLTINAGVRWDYITPLHERDNLALLPVPDGNTTGRDIVLNPDGEVNFVDGFYFEPDKNNFAPNIGVAWDVFGDGKTVIRGGYSQAYINDEAIRSFDNASDANAGLSATISRSNLYGTLQADAGTFITDVLAPPEFRVPISYAENFDRNPGAAAFTVDPEFQTPKYHQWNISFEREIGWDSVVSLRYVGNRSTNLARGIDYNQVDVTNNGFGEDVARARSNGFLALEANGTFNPNYNPNIPGSQPLTVFPLLANGGLLSNSTIQSLIRTGEAGTLAQIYYQNGLAGSVVFTANPSTFVADVLENRGISNYHAFQAEIKRRFVDGLMFQANYTWSKSLTDASGLNQAKFEPYINNATPHYDYARAEWDTPHVFKANAIYELPFGEGKRWEFDKWFLGKVISGWEVTSIINLQSGSPFSILSSRGTLNRVGRSFYNTVDSSLTHDQIEALFGLFDTPNGLYFINPAVINPEVFSNTSYNGPGGASVDGEDPFPGQVFFNPGAGRLGALERLQFNGPKVFTWDLGFIKRTDITEQINMEMRFEFFNILNHPVFFVGNQNINSPTFGQVTTTLVAPRVVQLAVKLAF